MGAPDLYSRSELKEDIHEMVVSNPELASLYINITDHILSHTRHGVNVDLVTDPRGIKISPIAMDHNGVCSIAIHLPS